MNPGTEANEGIRNIAHADHGKTTLVDTITLSLPMFSLVNPTLLG
jgi:predicted membrane GTPase involved in stress response